MKEIRILSPQGMLGYGYPSSSFEEGLQASPDMIAVDAGSTDGGPHRLGLGMGGVSRYATKKDLQPLILAAKERHIPLIIGSAGGSGAGKRVDWLLDIVKEIAKEQGLRLKVATIYADINKQWLYQRWQEGKVDPVDSAPPLSAESIKETTALVAQMGVEPYLEALKEKPDIIIGGRTYDPVMSAALPILNGMDPGLAFHLGKILECGALAATPGTAKDGMLGILRDGHFLVQPLNPERKCTAQSVAAHTMYEKSHPYYLHGPGGMLDLSECRFEQVDERTVKVSGSRFIPSESYTVKVEGVRQDGFRTVLICGIRDPYLLQQLDEVLAQVQDEVRSYFDQTSFQMFFKVYGRDGVMGAWEPEREALGHEVGLVAEVVAGTQEMADSICAYTRSLLMHFDYKGRVSTAGNLALPFAPPEFSAGPVFSFSVYHAVTIDDPLSLFPVKYVELRGE
ncbi:3-methylaspartate ammonia-lyase [Caldalkalibacillus thermarum]|uniref:acyclic terpene utilization AtuA family protein n=1 Tax=Caldalkalibacillus thermarum TaxID=296745 RepID=UPI00166924A7|nr:acyclic terpene utilization AtuA family protein [Caldalkalibacillus thermarum]GGK29185.1 3-methylaspartate ammonia-lyase [Caldalkalibacillus thermarum]